MARPDLGVESAPPDVALRDVAHDHLLDAGEAEIEPETSAWSLGGMERGQARAVYVTFGQLAAGGRHKLVVRWGRRAW